MKKDIEQKNPELATHYKCPKCDGVLYKIPTPENPHELICLKCKSVYPF